MIRHRTRAAMLAIALLPRGALRAQETDSRAQDPTDGDAVAAALELVSADLREEFREALAELSADNWQVRERAETWIEQADVPEAAIEALLEAHVLAPEQEHRLVGALRDRILNQERGAMGIKMTTGTSPVQVVEVRPNMPAQGRLREGDVIVSIDGIAILTSVDLERVLRDRRPGQQIEVMVRRRQPEGGDNGERPDEEATVSVPITLTDDSLFSEDERLLRRQERIARAREVVLRHAPRPDVPASSNGATATSGEAFEIESLRRQLTLYQNTNDEATRRMFEEEWRAMRDALLIATLAPGISEEERQRRWDLYIAYDELLPPVGD